MKNVFIDTNILMDIFSNREPFVKMSLKIYILGNQKQIQLYTSSNTITTLHYLLKKYIDEEKIRMALEQVLENIQIIPVDANIIRKSLKSNHKDFEDAIQIISAQSIHNMDCIITRDLKDYKNSEIKVFTPDEFLSKIK
ncbi:Predicted nucleic acid-binding protein, contains PIN domain [Flavobacterium aquidurense]|uniref:Twitching motility protein PilT n=1 Tax=Flavobacterium frigidimaris TaxID=262320 RepID=A0ABX4BVE8_FLAFR|nr:PIN domain-containing protein [Flavobacterium frigidimaris]OXA81354.1 twitching motility protein PilT [Flavobacterium frigidimaris]SDZ02259.1 Predicted nucleic acid-binding protein, contains PIN domain [Flavobacterium aquidurense]